MPTAWIYRLKKPELMKEAEDRDIPVEGRTVEQIRKDLVEAVRGAEEFTTPEKQQPPAMSEDEQTEDRRMKTLFKQIREWNLSFRGTDNAVEFLERLEELIAASGVERDDILRALPRILQGKALQWYRNNARSWKSWDEFLELFKLYYFPSNYEEDLIVRIVARKQKFRETFTDYVTDLQTLMRRYQKLTEAEQLHRIHENMLKEYKLYIKKQEYTNLPGLLRLAAEYEKISSSTDGERYREKTYGTEAYKPREWNPQVRPGPSNETRDRGRTPAKTENNNTRIHPRYNPNTCCWACGKPGHNTKECRGQPKIFCSQCGKLGTLSRNCCKKRQWKAKEHLETALEGARRDNRIHIEVVIMGKTYKCLVDTGSTNTYVNYEVYRDCITKVAETSDEPRGIVLANGTTTRVEKSILVDLQIKGEKIKHWVRVLPSATCTILGMDVLRRIGMQVSWKGDTQSQTPREGQVEKEISSSSTSPPPNQEKQDIRPAKISPQPAPVMQVKTTIPEEKQLKSRQKERERSRHYPNNPKQNRKSRKIPRYPICASQYQAEVAGGESWRGVARSPSRESVTTDLSLFSVSSAASDARALRLLACKAGQGPDPSLRVASPNPESKLQKRPSSGLPLHSTDACKSLLAGCAALCAALGLRRSLSAGDVAAETTRPRRSATSEVGLCAALEALTLSSASRSCSTWVAVGGSQLPSPQRASAQPAQRLLTDNKKIRQNYIKRRLLTTYKALERMSQSEFNLDKLEAAAVASALAGPGPTTLSVPSAAPLHTRFAHPEACALALTAADLERERGRPLSKYERNMMIFNWLHSLDDQAPF